MGAYTLKELAKLTESKLVGDPAHRITGVDDLETASSSDAAFLENPRYEKQMRASQAGVIVTSPSFRPEPGKRYLLNENPSLAFQNIIELFIQTPSSGFTGIHPTAVIHEEAELGEKVTVGPHAVIDRGAKIGEGTRIGPNVSIGAEVTVGAECLFHPSSVVREGCEIGNRVILQPGAVVGSCGFGFFTDKEGNNHKLKQLGKVILEDDVEIGANTTIDRARFKTTRIGRGTKIDNLVQIAHQVEIGPNNLMASQVGIAGSTKTGRNVVMGGQVGVAGHISIADGAIFAAVAKISKSIDKGGIYSGIPAIPIKECNLHYVQLKSVGKLIQRVKELEAAFKKLHETRLFKE
ncbi:MAG: UDP-3-O-(3-hydroxymyristoyl)glucosamine N-acyltransferase [Chlamydiales bacterium]|nr:UDP-3-O-(3-hydroxymyristoyl)glucosamine N-acyltransferase [Chlamydiales bacterium]